MSATTTKRYPVSRVAAGSSPVVSAVQRRTRGCAPSPSRTRPWRLVVLVRRVDVAARLAPNHGTLRNDVARARDRTDFRRRRRGGRSSAARSASSDPSSKYGARPTANMGFGPTSVRVWRLATVRRGASETAGPKHQTCSRFHPG